MSSVFGSSFGGIRIMPSATSEANVIKGQASMQEKADQEFAKKLKAAQEKAEQINLVKTKDQQDDQKLREVCQEMEAVFLNLMLGKMRDTIPERTLFPKSNGEKMMQSMLDIELTRVMAQSGGMGLGDLLYKQLINPGIKNLPANTVQPQK